MEEPRNPYEPPEPEKPQKKPEKPQTKPDIEELLLYWLFAVPMALIGLIFLLVFTCAGGVFLFG